MTTDRWYGLRWYGVAPCGCIASWTAKHPAQLTPDDRTIDASSLWSSGHSSTWSSRAVGAQMARGQGGEQAGTSARASIARWVLMTETAAADHMDVTAHHPILRDPTSVDWSNCNRTEPVTIHALACWWVSPRATAPSDGAPAGPVLLTIGGPDRLDFVCWVDDAPIAAWLETEETLTPEAVAELKSSWGRRKETEST
jgi:hypothetical protein